MARPRKTREKFISEANTIHNHRYTYDNVVYVDSNTKISVTCCAHGDWLQAPTNHLAGNGCPMCNTETQRNTTEEFVKKANRIHNNRYTYTKTLYTQAHSKVIVTCSSHGDFEITPDNHLHGKGCPGCCSTKKLSLETFITKSSICHRNKYDYTKSIYVNSFTSIEIVCPSHGSFWQLPTNHMRDHGCPKCNSSKKERETREFLLSHNEIFEEQKTFPDCKYKNILPFDFYIPSRNLLIECDGKQHDEPFSKFGGLKKFEETKIRDAIKTEYCNKDNTPNLLRIKHNDSVNKILSSILSPPR